MDYQVENEEAIRERRRQRVKEMQEHKQKQLKFRKFVHDFTLWTAGITVFIAFIFTGIKVLVKDSDRNNKMTYETEVPEESDNNVSNASEDVLSTEVTGETIEGAGQNAEFPTETKVLKIYSAKATDDTVQVGEDVISDHAILIGLDDERILAQRNASDIMNPASMTKILTVLVAAESISKEDLDDTFTITIDITDYSYSNDCSSVGFAENETVTVRDLFYGTILPSGADAAVGLATYVAGSQEAFVDMMNEKLEELGLSETAHFTNCVGLYDEEHYCTAYDMAIMLEAAIDNDFCREVLSAHTYTTSSTKQHPEGITISNWFLRRIEDKDSGGEVVCGKTGYVVQSGNCAASYAKGQDGKEYICVTAGSSSAWRCIYDHVAIYKQFIG